MTENQKHALRALIGAMLFGFILGISVNVMRMWNGYHCVMTGLDKGQAICVNYERDQDENVQGM